jgi:hypothetical protein
MFGSSKLKTPLRLISPFSLTSRKPPAVPPKQIVDSSQHKRLKVENDPEIQTFKKKLDFCSETLQQTLNQV